MKPKVIFLSIAGTILLIVLLQNTQVVSFRFLLWQLNMSRIILYPLIMLTGAGIGFFMGRKSGGR